jgi:acyl-CoA reductase-like NAD-dependent aldehyde dehydrogenase
LLGAVGTGPVDFEGAGADTPGNAVAQVNVICPHLAAQAVIRVIGDLDRLVEEGGLPPGVLSIVAADKEVSEYLVSHPPVDKVAFTGSTAAGKRIHGNWAVAEHLASGRIHA